MHPVTQAEAVGERACSGAPVRVEAVGVRAEHRRITVRPLHVDDQVVALLQPARALHAQRAQYTAPGHGARGAQAQALLDTAAQEHGLSGAHSAVLGMLALPHEDPVHAVYGGVQRGPQPGDHVEGHLVQQATILQTQALAVGKQHGENVLGQRLALHRPL